jgi:far upstream element-binding protein
MSAEEALARAKAIAAKLSGTATDTSNSNKRSRWGLAPGTSSDAPVGGGGTTGSNKRSNTEDGAEKATKRVWISTTEERPAAHFRAYLNPRFPDLLAQLDKDGDVECTMELQGRGSGGKPPLPGMPLEPLHVSLEGTSAQLSQAEALVDSLLQEAETAPVEEEAIRLDKEAEENKKYQLATVGSNGGTSAYRPASVALLIGQAANPEVHLATDGPWIETSIEVPSGLVGYIIGKGGENVARVQAQTGARLQIQREVDLLPGQTTRTISISAPTEQAASDCQRFIENIVAEKSRQIGVGQSSSSASSSSLNKDMQRVQEAINAGHEHIIVKVPDEDVGLVIGKGGATIKSLQERTGASVQVLSNSDADGMRQVHVTHPETAGAMQVKTMIEDILKSKAAKKDPEQVAQTTIEVHIPDSDVGLCIGRQYVSIGLFVLLRYKYHTLHDMTFLTFFCFKMLLCKGECYSIHATNNEYTYPDPITVQPRGDASSGICIRLGRRMREGKTNDSAHRHRAVVSRCYEWTTAGTAILS